MRIAASKSVSQLGMHWKRCSDALEGEGRTPLAPLQGPYGVAALFLTATASPHGISNRQ